VKLIPLGDRIMVRPAKRAEQTTSGLWLSEHRKPEMGGTVVAVGPCEHPLKGDAEELAEFFQHRGFEEESERIRLLVAKEPLVKVGDYVVFSWQSGQELWVEDERLLIMRESDVLAVVEE
jgi:chaperonin GroES